MKTRVIFLMGFMFSALMVQVLGQYKTFVLRGRDPMINYPAATNFVVEAGIAVEAVRVALPCVLGADEFTVAFPESPGSTNYVSAGCFDHGEIVVGPALIRMRAPAFCDAWFYTIRIIRQTDEFTPSTAVVIPADAKGPVNILMESSADHVNWIQALPGTYGTSSQQRYFRVRAVHQ